ncbi:MAG: fibronectin type III domain-containing protein, partial [bacterium]|nr:fibronectin type III domain-containing protein [bacterium]
SNDNDYMGKMLGFDLCIGFSGGNFQCGDTVIGEEHDTDGNSEGGGGSISGTGGGSIQLVVENESATFLDGGNVVIEWDTNKFATSQVVYGPAVDGPYTLDINLPNLGYPSSTTEDPAKVTEHSVTLTGLPPGTYLYRVVSRASPASVSEERSFAISNGFSGSVIATNSVNEPEGLTLSLASLSSDGLASQPQESDTDVDTVQVASAFFGLGQMSTLELSAFGIIILLALALVWFFRRRRSGTQ